ncbi:MAG: phosphoribosylanthranilate isomerase [candidate division NC10 bacterium]|nr:phosphoribosylanthranilate isomerase [candidate division NC10 bacterium]
MTRVKICGITNVGDALLAVEAGADALGFIFVEGTPRYVPPSRVEGIIGRIPPLVATVGVFANQPLHEVERLAKGLHLSVVQLHGDEDPEGCRKLTIRFIKAIRIKDVGSLDTLPRYPRASAFLLDSFAEGRLGGTGHSFPWELAVKAKAYGPIILSGGLTPENVEEAVTRVHPYGVDVSSGVEASPGRKDPQKLRAFIERAKGAT